MPIRAYHATDCLAQTGHRSASFQPLLSWLSVWMTFTRHTITHHRYHAHYTSLVMPSMASQFPAKVLQVIQTRLCWCRQAKVKDMGRASPVTSPTDASNRQLGDNKLHITHRIPMPQYQACFHYQQCHKQINTLHVIEYKVTTASCLPHTHSPHVLFIITVVTTAWG